MQEIHTDILGIQRNTSEELHTLASEAFKYSSISHSLMKESLWFLLDNQYVSDKVLDQELKVIKGSGMGLPHSGGVAELAFMFGGELRALTRQQELGIFFYGRFKDDCLIIFDDYDNLKIFVEDLREGHPFTIECESISSKFVHYLEVGVEKTLKEFLVYPVSKPSTQHTPWLEACSSHPRSIHASWPISRLKARLSLCSTERLKSQEVVKFKSQAERQHISRQALNSIFSHGSKNVAKSGKLRSVNGRTHWLILPYVPLLAKSGLGSVINRFFKAAWVRSSFKALFDECVSIRVAYRNVLKPASVFLRRTGGRKG